MKAQTAAELANKIMRESAQRYAKNLRSEPNTQEITGAFKELAEQIKNTAKILIHKTVEMQSPVDIGKDLEVEQSQNSLTVKLFGEASTVSLNGANLLIGLPAGEKVLSAKLQNFLSKQPHGTPSVTAVSKWIDEHGQFYSAEDIADQIYESLINHVLPD